MVSSAAMLISRHGAGNRGLTRGRARGTTQSLPAAISPKGPFVCRPAWQANGNFSKSSNRVKSPGVTPAAQTSCGVPGHSRRHSVACVETLRLKGRDSIGRHACDRLQPEGLRGRHVEFVQSP